MEQTEPTHRYKGFTICGSPAVVRNDIRLYFAEGTVLLFRSNRYALQVDQFRDRLLTYEDPGGKKRLPVHLLIRFQEAVPVIWDQTDKLVRAAVRAIPDGVYEASSFLDDNGRAMNKTIPLKIKVEVHGDELTIDYSEVSLAMRAAGFFRSIRHRS